MRGWTGTAGASSSPGTGTTQKRLEVAFVGAEERPLERVLGTQAGEFVRRLHESHGVRFRLGRHPVEIRADAVVLDDGSVERSDFVVAGIGVEPELDLAQRAGLRIDRGIVVDDHLQTSAPNVFAAGDAARFPEARTGRMIRIEHWGAAARQDRRRRATRSDAASASPTCRSFWSQHYDLVFAYVGHAERSDDAQLFGSLDEHSAAVLYRDAGRIAAITTLFRDDVSLGVEAAMERGATEEEIFEVVRRAF